jgi:hypothetical protein
VEAIVEHFETQDNRTVLQIDTRGSEERENPGKQSQTLQLGEEAARQLFNILKRTYNFD